MRRTAGVTGMAVVGAVLVGCSPGAGAAVQLRTRPDADAEWVVDLRSAPPGVLEVVEEGSGAPLVQDAWNEALLRTGGGPR